MNYTLGNKEFNVAVLLTEKPGMLGPIEVSEEMVKNGAITEFKAKSKKEVSYIVVGTKDAVVSDYELFGGFVAPYLKKYAVACVVGLLDQDKVKQLIIGFELGMYSFDKYYSKKETNELASVMFNVALEDFENLLEEAMIISESTNFARTLVNEPANVLQPDSYENIIIDRYAESDKVKIEIIKGDALAAHQMNGLIEVGKGSKYQPRMVVLSFNNAPEKEEIALVGKGLTFDSGGMNLKTQRYVGNMKTDMGGSAATLGAFDACVNLDAPVNITCYLSICENIISKDMVLAGDVIHYPNGVSVEVGNTDAEGRLVLADALLYAQANGAKKIIDAATLTGAAIMALGDEIAAIMGNNQEMMNGLIEAGAISNERIWQLPMVKEYTKYLKSDHADIMNIALNAPGAGSSTAALFLEHFIQEGTQWAHLDIAGTAYVKKLNYKEKATGFGVRTILNYVLNSQK